MDAQIPATKAHKRVLVVEDDPHSMEILREALVQDGSYNVMTANSADEALREVARFRPQLVITDQDMPGFTGLDLLKELRKQKNYVTVIFVSGRGDVDVVSQALRAGADDYIRKPFRIEELLARVETCFRNNELHKDLLLANEKLQDMVEHDYLTGLYNMRSMYDRIDYELKRARRYNRCVTCVMMDMDHFKTVNDYNDHLFGSFVLKEVGAIVTKTMREVDFAARYGGDEFLVVLTEADEKGGAAFCERLRKAIQTHEFRDGSNSIRLTVSLGFATSRGSAEIDARSLVRSADHALYKAKNMGRNRAIRYEPGS